MLAGLTIIQQEQICSKKVREIEHSSLTLRHPPTKGSGGHGVKKMIDQFLAFSDHVLKTIFSIKHDLARSCFQFWPKTGKALAETVFFSIRSRF